jgi:hypothetical protein
MQRALNEANVEVIVAATEGSQVLPLERTLTSEKSEQVKTPPSVGRTTKSGPTFSAPDRFVD